MDLIRPLPRLAQVGPVQPSAILSAVLELPGVRLIQDAVGGEHLQLPRSTWPLTVVRQFCIEHRIDPPVWSPQRSLSTPLGAPLRDYQRVGVDWLLHYGGGVLADSLGLGKTQSAAVAAKTLSTGSDAPVIILGPKFLRRTWRDELERIGALERPEDFHALEGVTLRLDKWSKTARYIFCHYDIVPVWWNWIWPLRPSAVILDEAHYLKNWRTKRATGVAQAIGVCPNRILLTGTPILNCVSEFWNLLQMAEGSWSFGTMKDFRLRHCGAQFNGYALEDGDPTNVPELQARLESCYLRRTVQEVGLELPPLTRSIISVPLDDKAQVAYEGFFSRYTPRQLIDALLKNQASGFALELLSAVRKFTSKHKLQTTIARVTEHLDAGEDVVVFVWERSVAEKIASSVVVKRRDKPATGATVIHGGVSQDVRDILISDFQKTGGCIVATLDSLSVGVNLQRARVCVIHDLDWTPAKLLQAEGRVWRQGQTRPVLSEWIVLDHSLDTFFVEHIQNKADIIEKALNDNQASRLADVLFEAADDFEARFTETLNKWRIDHGAMS